MDQSQGADDRWVRLSEAEARRHPSFGLGGWLLVYLVYVGLIVAVGASELVDATHHREGMSTYRMAATLVVALRMLLGLYSIYAAMRLRPVFVAVSIALIALSAVSLLIDVVVFVASGHFSVLKTETVVIVLAELIFLAWFLYLRFSVRVNVTYLNRIPSRQTE